MGKQEASFGAGCFWGSEKFFKRQFKEGINKIEVGYQGGKTKKPTYDDVCSGETGHAEVVHIEYDPKVVDYKDLVRLFFRFHDPTQVNRQGNDRGTQYRSAIFYYTSEQKAQAEGVKEEMAPHWAKLRKEPICTEISPAGQFYKAEAYHQGYLDANPNGYCNHKLYF